MDVSIKKIVEDIEDEKILIPTFQRSYVWKEQQIKELFDTILKGYLVAGLAFVPIEVGKKLDSPLYRFMRNYNQCSDNRIYKRYEEGDVIKENVFVVMDGQQRLTSLYIALKGTYALRGPHGCSSKKRLYLNLLGQSYDFEFLTDEEASEWVDEEHLWFLVKKSLSWDTPSEANRHARNLKRKLGLSDEKEGKISNLLIKLFQKLTVENTISFKVSFKERANANLKEMSEMYIKYNTTGVPLSNSDLLFAKITPYWYSCREEVKLLLKIINQKGDGFKFDPNFIFNTCFALNDLPIYNKVENFNEQSIIKIKNNWQEMSEAVRKAVDLFVKFEFSAETLKFTGAVIPIAYFFMKTAFKNDTSNEENMRKFIIYSLLTLNVRED